MNKEDKLAYAASVLFASIGLTLMYISIGYYGPESVEIHEIDTSLMGEEVEIEGQVRDPFHTGEHLFFELEDSRSSVEVAKFDTGSSLTRGQQVKVVGSVDMHEGDLNIIAEEIRS